VASVDSYVRGASGLPATASKNDHHFAYFAAQSGLGAKRSLADHQLATYRAVLSRTTGSINDLRKLWAASLSLDHTGGW
jgi:hypothetical protein